MSGICGIVRMDERPVDPTAVLRMAAPLGPRGTGVQEVLCRGPVGLAAQHHAVEAPGGPGSERAFQRSGVWAGLDGELYNASGIRAELARQGVQPGPTTADLLVDAYIAWGGDCFRRLNGSFAAVIWDSRTRELWLARDPQGVKSLFYGQQNGLFAFGSELKSITACPDFVARLEHEAVWEFLTFLYVPPPRTMWRDACELRQGHRLNLTGGSVSVVPFAPEPLREADSDPGGPGDLSALTEDGAVRQLETKLVGAVATRLDPRGSTGLMLSGGVDSSMLAVLGARLSSRDLLTYTVGVDDSRLDESGPARDIARHLGLKHEILTFTRTQCRAALPRLIDACDGPLGDPACLYTLLAFETLRGAVRVILDGDGADSLFGLEPSPDVCRALRLSGWWPASLRAVMRSTMRWLPGDRWEERADLLDYERPAELLISWEAWKGRQHRQLTGVTYPFEQTDFYRITNARRREGLFTQYTETRSQLWGTYAVLRRVERLAIRNGLVVRLPYEDLAIVEFLQGLPRRLRWRPGQEKPLLKSLLGRSLPRALWDRPKRGFTAPLDHLLSADDFALVREYVTEARSRGHGLYRWPAAAEAATAYQHGDRRFRDKVWALVLLEVWLERHRTVR